MITAWHILCDNCRKTWQTAYIEEDACPYCGRKDHERNAD